MKLVLFSYNKAYMIELQAFFRTLYMSCNVICNITKTNKPLTTQYILLTYYLLTYLLESNPGNPVPATRYPVPKPVTRQITTTMVISIGILTFNLQRLWMAAA